MKQSRSLNIRLVVAFLFLILIFLPPTLVAASIFSEDFSAYSAGSDPIDWFDTAKNNSLVEDDSLFKTFELNGERLFGTTSTMKNIHSHYLGAGSATWSDYEYSGRMKMTAGNGGIGVTLLSDYPNRDAYYRLRRYGSSAFYLEPHGTTITGGTTDTGVVPVANEWYWFKVQVEDTGSRTEIRAKVWAEGTAEPADWQVEAYDDSGSRLTVGTIGVWSFNPGSKYWDDLSVNPLSGGGDTTPPVISNIQVTADETTATVSWTTDEPADSSVAYGPTTAYENGTVDDSGLVSNHSLTLTGLSEDTTYHYQVSSTDGSGNPASSADLTFTTTSGGDTTPPVISNIQVTADETTATVTWTTDEPADSSVAYGPTTAYENGTVDDSGLVSNHSLTLTGLSEDTTYHYQVSSTDGSGNPASSADLTFTTTSGGDTTPPVISNIQVTADETTATVTWTTDEPADSSVAYGPTIAYENGTVDDPALVTNHSLTLTGLTEDTTYHYQVSSTDGSGNPASSADLTFTTDAGSDTTPPVISNIQVTADETTATVTWTTDEPADSSVAYGPTTAYENGTVDDPALVTNHSLTLTGLTPDTTYHYQVNSTDGSGNTASSVDLNFTTNASSSAYSENFSAYSAGSDPADWFDTEKSSSMVEDDSLFKTFELNGERFFGTTSILTNIHSHYLGAGSETWSDYEFSGRMKMTAGNSGIGVTILSDYPNRDAYYRLRRYGSSAFNLNPHGTSISGGTTNTGVVPIPDVWYWFKVQVEDTGSRTEIRAKVWAEGTSEPTNWQVEAYDDSGTRLTAGTIGFWSYYVGGKYWDDLSVNPLGGGGDTTPPVISNIQVTADETTATVTWTTDEPADSSVAYGETTNYENGTVNNPALVTDHNLTLTGLTPDTTYHYQVSSTDGSGNPASSADLTFTTTSGGTPSTIVSDDFNACSLNTGLWSLIDPVGDATLSMSGEQVLLSVPAGTSHDVWTGGNFAPRIMQPANDVDFELEVKFESAMSEQYQMQGLLIEQDSDNFLRLEFYSDGSNTRIFAASFSNGSPTIEHDSSITGGVPIYMRLKREGDQWTQSYSTDGQAWTTSVSFEHGLGVTAVGVFVGNAGGSPPAHTGVIDYVFNTASPIGSEDADPNTLTVNVEGDGTVDKDPDQGAYDCEEIVTLTAISGLGWSFSGWGGDLSGSTNPTMLTISGDHVVMATFSQGGDTTPPVISNIQVTADETTATVSWTTDEPANSSVAYGETQAYGSTANNPALVTDHSLTLTSLTPDKLYHYQVTSVDGSGNLASSPDDTFTTQPVSPDIDIWYGQNQVFGNLGHPQPWINILGNVSSPHEISTLVYSLNGGSEIPLSIGPDLRRLESPGDFNVDVHYADLDIGPNQVVITATDVYNTRSAEIVTVNYMGGNIWPQPYSIVWSNFTDIQDAAQIVDGLWAIQGDSVRTDVRGYDRLIAIGDVTWADYEVTVPVTIHSMHSGAGGIGFLMRWDGHTDDPVSGWQPKSGWLPLGAIGWYRANPYRLELFGNDEDILAETPRVLATEVAYIFKMRVETIPGQGGLYSFKVWEEGQPEPTEWDLTAQEQLTDPQNGSMLLLAHHTDASFGQVTIVPVSDTTPPVLSNIQISAGDTSATVTWTTDEPATSSVAYGLTPAYGSTANNPALVTDHSLTLTDLFTGTLYHYQVTSTDGSGNSASSVDLNFTTNASSSAYSEDFSGYSAGSDPVDWLDTGANSSMVEDDSLFKTFELNGERLFGTTSILANIHSHYLGAGSATWSDYEYSGRMKMTAGTIGIGVTILSDYPNRDAYYRLRRYGSSAFKLNAHGTSISGGTTNTGVVPVPDVWYWFKVQVEDTGSRTEIRAKVWAEGTAEPTNWQVEAYDDSGTRLTAGTIGFWSYYVGGKYWDDLVVKELGQ